MRRSYRPRRELPFAVLVTLLSQLFLLSCSAPEEEAIVELADSVPFQALNVAIDRVDPLSKVGLDRLEDGWEIKGSGSR